MRNVHLFNHLPHRPSVLALVLAATLIGSTAFAQEPVTSPSAPAVSNPSPTPSATPDTGTSVDSQEKPGLIRRSLRSFLRDDVNGDGRGVHAGPFAPRVVILSSGAGPAPLLHFWMPDIGGTRLDIHASAAYSIYKYQYYDAQIGLMPHRGQRLPSVETGTNAIFPLADIEKTAGSPGFNLYASARHRDYPREDFFGVGPSTLSEAHADFRLKDSLYEGVMRFEHSHFSVMGRAGVLKTSVGVGEDSKYPDVSTSFNSTTAPGVSSSPDFLHASLGGWLEFRDEPGNPHRGAAFGIAYSHFDDRNADVFQFNRLVLEGRQYVSLHTKRHVLAFKQTLSFDSPSEGRSVPFYLRPTLGGGSLLRGYASSRFRDDRLMYLIGEYRFELTPKVELAAIYEAGKVFPGIEGVNFHDLRRSFGGGIRFKSPRKVHLRLDIVKSTEGTRVHLKLGRSF
ncbi:MAG: BamA/TamA family outer membrane protein [Vicinamibacteria bacterium]